MRVNVCVLSTKGGVGIVSGCRVGETRERWKKKNENPTHEMEEIKKEAPILALSHASKYLRRLFSKHKCVARSEHRKSNTGKEEEEPIIHTSQFGGRARNEHVHAQPQPGTQIPHTQMDRKRHS